MELAARARLPRACSRTTRTSAGATRVLSYFGLVPAALMGVNVEALLHRAQVAEQNCAQFDSPRSNSGLWLGCALGELALQGRDKLTFVVSTPIASFGLWVEQLIAESTGKHGKGILPVADEPLGDAGGLRRRPRVRLPAQRGRARRGAGRRDRGARPGRPPDDHAGVHGGPTDLGPDLLLRRVRRRRWPAGRSEINPFDQPNVQEAKDNTEPGARRRALPEPSSAGSRDELLAAPAPPHYVAIMGYAAAVRRVRRGRRASCARRSASATKCDDHVRLRAALPALDRPVPQGRPADRPLPPARPRRATRTSRFPGAGYTFEHAQERAGASATCRRCGRTGLRAEAQRSRRSTAPDGRSRRLI